MGPKRDASCDEDSVAEAKHTVSELNKQNTAYVDSSLVWKGKGKEQYWSNKRNETITKPRFLGFVCFVFKRMEPLGSLWKLITREQNFSLSHVMMPVIVYEHTHVHLYVPVCVVYACVCVPVCIPLHKGRCTCKRRSEVHKDFFPQLICTSHYTVE